MIATQKFFCLKKKDQLECSEDVSQHKNTLIFFFLCPTGTQIIVVLSVVKACSIIKCIGDFQMYCFWKVFYSVLHMAQNKWEMKQQAHHSEEFKLNHTDTLQKQFSHLHNEVLIVFEI